MTIIGFNFASITASRDEGITGKVNINNNVTITNIEEKTLNLGAQQKALKVDFSYKTEYVSSKTVGKIDILGNMLYLAEEKKAKEILDAWKSTKQVDPNFMLNVINTTLNKCNIQALVIADTIGLPAPVKLPQAQLKEEQLAQQTTAAPISKDNKKSKK